MVQHDKSTGRAGGQNRAGWRGIRNADQRRVRRSRIGPRASWAWARSQHERHRAQTTNASEDWADDGDADCGMPFDGLEREPLESPLIELGGPRHRFPLAASRSQLRTPFRDWDVPAEMALPPRLRSSGLLDDAPTTEEMEWAAESVLGTCSWFAPDGFPCPPAQRELAETPAPQQGLRTSSDSFPPVSGEPEDEQPLGIRTVRDWSRLATVASAAVVSLVILAAISSSTGPTRSWSSALRQVVAGLGIVEARAALALPSRRGAMLARGPTGTKADPRSLAEAVVDKLVARGSGPCSLSSLAPASLSLEVVFKPSGTVDMASVVGPGASAARATDCLQLLVRGARIPAFDGDKIAVVRRLRIE